MLRRQSLRSRPRHLLLRPRRRLSPSLSRSPTSQGLQRLSAPSLTLRWKLHLRSMSKLLVATATMMRIRASQLQCWTRPRGMLRSMSATRRGRFNESTGSCAHGSRRFFPGFFPGASHSLVVVHLRSSCGECTRVLRTHVHQAAGGACHG